MSEITKPSWLDATCPEELGYSIHVALREACDSTTSSLVWNLVYLFDEAWKGYLKCAWEEICKVEISSSDMTEWNTRKWSADDRESVVVALQQGAEKFDGTYWETAKGSDDLMRKFISFYCALRLLTDEDWKGMVAYL